uniref:Putative secreted peptide n=1 Tax=Anopheles braziliensis TaxID=58242 RepID=A0A2M3ZSB4_9DIPT
MGNNRGTGRLANRCRKKFTVPSLMLLALLPVAFPRLCHTAPHLIVTHLIVVVMVYFLHFSFLCPLGERTIPRSISLSLSRSLAHQQRSTYKHDSSTVRTG